MRRTFFFTLIVVGLVGSFAYGVAVGHYKFFPFNTLVELKGKIDEPRLQSLTLDQQLKQYAFTREAPINGLIHPAISSAEDMHQLNRSILIPRENYHHAYANISIGIAEQLHLNGTPILKLPFRLNDIAYEAYAYGTVYEDCDRSIPSAALIIPGSGNNQSLGIYLNRNI